MPSAPAIAFEPRPSRLLMAATLLIAGLALLSIGICGAPWWLSLPMMLFVIASTIVAIRQHLHPRYRNISHDRSGWQLDKRLGDTPASAELLDHARLGDLLILRFRSADDHWRSLIAPDAIDPDTRRRLLLTLASLPAAGAARNTIA